MKDETIKIIISNNALNYELNIQKWAVNCNTKKWLMEKITEFLNDVLPVPTCELKDSDD